ncbi:helix-turn-helix domain-containing protein [Nisaea sp.]|uniref:helix-turn-helix domain-containing protein n=1 Tax=Nisaea sp. TaxID=2024842 RepID=UPI003B5270D4
MDRRDTVEIFRSRLAESMERAGMNRSGLAKRVGVDRSTLSQLLSPENDRLPRADTVAAIAATLQVSLDWLLGLTQQEQLGAEILQRSLHITEASRAAADRNIAEWHAEAVGYKIRYVPANLPDQVKTPEVLAYEHGAVEAFERDSAIERTQERLAYTRRPETDIEICMPRQALDDFSAGAGIWSDLAPELRLAQLEQILHLHDELYPSMRIYLFDGRVVYSAPLTIFGPLRASLYLGQSFFVFNTTEHIRTLTRHFDQLIRDAVVQSHALPDYIRGLIQHFSKIAAE